MVCKTFKEKKDKMLLEEVNGIMKGYFMLVGKKAPFHKAADSVQVTPDSTLLLLRVQQCLCVGNVMLILNFMEE